ncbi:hypothetical protein TNCV_3332141 [Trichonephila clavipes]|nr:hypothetical protein TNCV_3332141 [Trichonephila clavipes]
MASLHCLSPTSLGVEARSLQPSTIELIICIVMKKIGNSGRDKEKEEKKYSNDANLLQKHQIHLLPESLEIPEAAALKQLKEEGTFHHL